MKYRAESWYNIRLNGLAVEADAIKVQKGMDIDAPQWFVDAVENKKLEVRGISKFTRDMPIVHIMVNGYSQGWAENNDWLVMIDEKIYAFQDGMFERIFYAIE